MMSRDELCQILLFLPGSDICHYSQINSIAYDDIISDQHLWTLLLRRDFHWKVEQLPFDQDIPPEQEELQSAITSWCDEMRDYTCNYTQFYQFPFHRVKSRPIHDSWYDPPTLKVLFGVPDSALNNSLIRALQSSKLIIPRNDALAYATLVGIDFECVYLASTQPKITPNLSIQLWTILNAQRRYKPYLMGHYLGIRCMVITINTKHAWNEDTYCTNHPHSFEGSNSLSRALTTLKETQPNITIVPPKACKGVLIVGLGAWQQDAPITKQRFFNDCSEVFDILPLEYFELTCENAEVMSDVLLRRFYTFYQRSVLEDGPVKKAQQPQEQQQQEIVATGWGCIMS